MRNIILSLLFFGCHLINSNSQEEPVSGSPTEENSNRENKGKDGFEDGDFVQEILYGDSLGSPALYASNLPSFSENSGCSHNIVGRRNLTSYRVTTTEARIYKEVVELIRETLLKEERLLKPYLKANAESHRPANLLMLVKEEHRYKIPFEIRNQLKKLRADFNKDVKKIIPYEYQYYRNGSNKVILSGLALALLEEGNNKELAKEEIATLAHLFSTEHNNSRAVFHTDTNFWPNGDVVFHFKEQNDFSDKELLAKAREEVRWAAAVWEEETAATVRFFETSKPQLISAVSDFLYGKRYNLEIYFGFQNTTLQGHASVGYLPFHKKDDPYNKMWLNTKKLKEDNVDEFRFVALHEFGHVLGLEHEHERADRDQYIGFNFPNKGPKKLQEESRNSVVRWKKMRVGNYSLALPYLQRCSRAKNFRTSPYDYFSVMQYPLNYAYTTRSQRQTLRMKFDGEYRIINDEIKKGVTLSNIRYNNNYKKKAFLSSYDVAAVLELYAAR